MLDKMKKIAEKTGELLKLQNDLAVSLSIQEEVGFADEDGLYRPLIARWSSKYPHKNKEDFEVRFYRGRNYHFEDAIAVITGDKIPDELFDDFKRRAEEDFRPLGSKKA
tara:strand:- start:558 stop:884 length:327 start_codon:yes stop_codon:yes gene_type:complete